MNRKDTGVHTGINVKDKKILLAILPYWDPIIPPNGIAHLKNFLQKNGYMVKTVDIIVERIFQELYRKYFKLLEECIPPGNRGNFYNIGHYLMQYHMMAHYNHDNEKEYMEVVKELVYKIYYTDIDNMQAGKLDEVLDEFYLNLEAYFLDLMEREKSAVFGLTAYKCTLPASLYVLKLVKKQFPHVKTVIGGGIFVDSHPVGTPNFEILLEYSKDFLDKIIIGQGELLFLKYLEGELPESQRVYTRKDINGEILQFPEIGIPDFSDFNLETYPYLVATASASCPNQCSFCCAQRYYGEHRVKNVKQTVHEMIELHKKYGHQLFFMTDSLLNPVVSDLARELAESEYSIYYDTYFRVDQASSNIENTMLWRRGGLYRVRLGTESGSQRILDLMGKNITTEQIKAAVAAFAHAGIKTTTYWLIGHPGETEADFQATLDLIEELKNDIYQAEANPFHYHSTSQTDADRWVKKKKDLFSEKAKKNVNFRNMDAGYRATA